MAVNDLITFRKGTASAWTSANPVLASGEPGFDLTNSVLKIGDGVSNWVSLSGIGSTSVGGSSPSSVGVRGIISTTGTLSSFSVSGGYPVGYLDLFQDGVKLVSTLDFSATDGSNVTLNNSVPSGTVLEYLTMASGVSSGGGSSGLSWSSVPESSSSSGTVGQIAYDTNYFYIATATNTWKRANLSKWPLISMNYLMVGGGGGGGAGRGGGGGAGGVLSSSRSIEIGEEISVVVGGGGAGTSVSTSSPATNGENSSVALPSETVVALGGGFGADGLRGLFTGTGMAGGNGGSGGGGSGYSPAGAGGSGAVGQGFAGGSGNASGEPYNGGSGGGAGGVGSNGSSANGGVGITDAFLVAASAGASVSGTPYVGGGGSGGVYQTTAGAGGLGGGGQGGGTNANGTAGEANTGGGGGGGGNSASGGNGGSGLVILRVSDTFTATTTGSPTVYTSGGYRYYKFTQNGTITFLTAS